MDKYPHITVEVHSIGSTAGIVGAYEGIADIGMSSRDLTGTERGWGLNEVIICYDPTVLDKSYPIVRSFIMLTKGAPDPVEQAFLDFILSPYGQEIIRRRGMVPS